MTSGRSNQKANMDRRTFLMGAAAGATLAAEPAVANVPTPYDWNASPSRQSREAFVEWMVRNRGEDPHFLAERFDRFQQLVSHHDVWDEADMRAFLLTPREEEGAHVGFVPDVVMGDELLKPVEPLGEKMRVLAPVAHHPFDERLAALPRRRGVPIVGRRNVGDRRLSGQRGARSRAHQERAPVHVGLLIWTCPLVIGSSLLIIIPRLP